MSKKSNDLSRRKFLSSGLLAISPLSTFFSSMVTGMVNQAHADTTGADLMNYIHLSMRGGPPRWMFDQVLRPNGNDQFIENTMLITKISNFKNLDASYESFKYRGYYFPHLWSFNVPKLGGGYRPIRQLLDNMISFRGVNLLSDGHGVSRPKYNAPVPGQPSINGLLADKSVAPIPALYQAEDLSFKSKNGVGSFDAGTANPIRDTLEPFSVEKALSLGNGDIVEEMINRSLDSLEKYAEHSSFRTRSLFKDRKNAKKLFLKNFGDLNSVYSNLVNKYEKLISLTFSTRYQGLSNQAIISDQSLHFCLLGDDKNRIPKGHDLRDMLVGEGQTLGTQGININFQNTSIQYLASMMALTEFVLVNGISNNVTGAIGSILGLYGEIFNGSSIQGARKYNQTTDAHVLGRYSTLFFFSYYYLAFSSCLLELFDRLKEAGIFNKTLFHLSGDFSRSARESGRGSDHGWQGATTSIFSGMIQEPHVIGNIKVESGYRDHPGSWGVSAHMDDLSGREMLVGNTVSSVASILGIESPTPNDQSFLSVKNGKVVNHASRPKNVA